MDNSPSDLAQLHKQKLNQKTEDYFTNVKYPTQIKNYIIQFNNEIDYNKLSSVSIDKENSKFRIVKVHGTAEHVASLLADSEIKYIELEQDIHILSESVPYGVEKTNAPQVWSAAKGDGIKVAILDTGISPHNDLEIAGGTSVVGGNYTDNDGHGTSVAGVLAAVMDDQGIVGVAPGAGIYAVKIMDGSSGQLSDAIDGVQWAIDNDMDIITMSFGMETYSQIFKEALQEAYADNILLIASAGNNNGDVLYPAAYADVIAVGATDENDERASFSAHGPELEIMAAGVNINSTSSGGYAVSTGTSLAAPHVAGVAALLKAYNISLTNNQIRAKLRNDALDLGDPGQDDYYGYGLVQANLEGTNYTLSNMSYFYEIYNITDYGTPDEDYLFWLNGTGSIDDVDFPIGMYLIKEYLTGGISEKKINVTDDGTLLLLTDYIDFDDDYTFNSTNGADDGVVWKNGGLDIEIYWDGGTILSDCYDWGDDGTADECYGDQSDMYLCAEYSATYLDWCTDADPGCLTFGSVGEHTLPTSASKSVDVDSLFCRYLSGSYGTNGQAVKTYYICNYRQYICSSSSQFQDTCITTTGPDYVFNAYTCPSGYYCDAGQDGANADFGASGISLPQNPCRFNSTAPKCNGSIEVIIEDLDGYGINDSRIYVNSAYNTSISNSVNAEININNTVCGISYSISAYCPDNVTLCGTSSRTIDTKEDHDSILFTCDMCAGKRDLWIESSETSFKKQSNQINVSTIVHSSNVSGSNVKVYIFTSFSNRKEITISQVDTFSTYNVSALITAEEGELVTIYADASDVIEDEVDEGNNVVQKLNLPKVNAYITVDTGLGYFVDSTIKDYLKNYVNSKDSEGDVDVLIYIGRNAIPSQQNTYTLSYLKWGLRSFNVEYNGKSEDMAYNGIVGKFTNPSDNKTRIFVYGNRIDGALAAVKRLISESSNFLDSNIFEDDYVIYLSKEDLEAIKVFDFLHTDENELHYMQSTTGFADIIENVLNDVTYDLSIKRVKTLSGTSYGEETVLRLKNVNSDLGSNLKEYAGINDTPVVFSGGLFSNLFAWEENNGLARQMAKEGWNVWEIEMTGGPNTDCDDCPNYNYDDLQTYYWPALIAGVIEYSNKTKVDYVGHSNGCRAALSSLNIYYNGDDNVGYYDNSGSWVSMNLPSQPVDTFVGVACPGTLNDETLFTSTAREEYLAINTRTGGYIVLANHTGDYAMYKLNGINHLEIGQYAKYFFPFLSFFKGQGKLSYNLMDYYNDLAVSNSSTIDLSNVNPNKLYLFATTPDDIIVPYGDQQEIIDAASSIGLGDKDVTPYNFSLLSTNHITIQKEAIPDIKETLK